MIRLYHAKQKDADTSTILLIHPDSDISQTDISNEEKKYLEKRINAKDSLIWLNRYNTQLFFVVIKKADEINNQKEIARRAAVETVNLLNKQQIEVCNLIDYTAHHDIIYCFCEGVLLTSYQFLKYFKNHDEMVNSFDALHLAGEYLSPEEVEELNIINQSVYLARDLINEPVSFLTATKLAEIASEKAQEAKLHVDVKYKKEIEELKMGGLLSVNKGSVDPPTFTTLTWKPDNAVNADPIALVGKGIVYDTGGLSLKPTPNSMDTMKADMGGGAVVIATMIAIARLKLPVYVQGFVPATDNRPAGNAYTPGDIITMYDRTTVEIKNTDAEGRLILADAITFANQFKPQLIINLATLTGSAAMAIGPYGIVGMGNASNSTKEKLFNSGENTYEPVTFFPFLEEYGKSLKSDVADISNLGEREGGAISAGKFLEHFAQHPLVHFDIAGPAFIKKAIDYRPKGGTGTGVRLLIDYLKSFS
ncbi:MAG: peptidase M17 [Bacteroidetes bacterium]|jgi:leucyl aminopeptidase|nr:peptidase M17 [Bacteroidota bacterium]